MVNERNTAHGARACSPHGNPCRPTCRRAPAEGGARPPLLSTVQQPVSLPSLVKIATRGCRRYCSCC